MRLIGTTTIAAAVALPFLLGAAAPNGCGSGQATAGQSAGPMPVDAPPMTGPAPLGPFSARARLRGFQETPAISTTGTGRLTAHVSDDGTSIAFELSWSGLQGGEATGAHFHIGQRGVPGGIVIHLCGTGGKPACPTQPATLTGTLTSADVVALPAQGIAAGAGVNLGLSLWRRQPYYEGEKWLGFPKEAVLDVLRIYAVVIPLFLVASLFEFLAV